MFHSLTGPLGLLDDLRIWGRGEVGLLLQPPGCAARWRKRCLRPDARNQVTGGPTSGATTAALRRPSSRVPGSAALGKLCRNPGLQGLDKRPGALSLHCSLHLRFPSRMLLMERTLLTHFLLLLLFCFQIPVYPLGAPGAGPAGGC